MGANWGGGVTLQNYIKKLYQKWLNKHILKVKKSVKRKILHDNYFRKGGPLRPTIGDRVKFLTSYTNRNAALF